MLPPDEKGYKITPFPPTLLYWGGRRERAAFSNPVAARHFCVVATERCAVFSFSPLIKRRQREKFCSQPKRKSFSVDRIVNVYRLYVRADFRFRVITSRNNNLDLILIWIMKLCELIGHV